MDILRLSRFPEMSCQGVEKVKKKADPKYMSFSNSLSIAEIHLPEAVSYSVPPNSLNQLALILGSPLPQLPQKSIATLARELREVSTPGARNTWVHPGWADVVQWVTHNVPDCDPVVPAIHAVRLAEQIRTKEVTPARVANYVLCAAKSSHRDQSLNHMSLNWDPPYIEESRPRSHSLSQEASELLKQNRIVLSGDAWKQVSEGIDIAVDWLDGFTSRSKLSGSNIFSSARNSEAMSSEVRLRRYFSGPTSRPLVSLLLGGDQWGSLARKASGNEASLVLWSLNLRRSRDTSGDDVIPPAPVIRAWRTTTNLIEKAVSSSEVNAIEQVPTVAA